MSNQSLEELIDEFWKLGASRILCKRLAENDNNKQQIYLGHGFESLNLLPFGTVNTDSSKKSPIMKAALPLSWMNESGQVAPATGTQLILYPEYPEVRMSGFIRGCPTAPSEHLRPVPAPDRRFNNGPDGRLLFFAILSARTVIAYLAPAGSAIAADFEARAAVAPFTATGVFLEVPLPAVGNPRSLLLAKLREIHVSGWHPSSRLHADGSLHPYVARNGGGYTLEALFGITPNGRAEPDFMGWELKAYGSDRVTLMTPEPDDGYYGREGVKAFVRRYGRVADGDAMYFVGAHKAGVACSSTGHTLTIRGFDPVSSKITDVDGGIYLMAADGETSAGWTFPRLLEHWGRKHASAAYIPYISRQTLPPAYQYNSPVLMGEGTSFTYFLKALAAGVVIYDPAPKISGVSTPNPKTKARSQFRISKKGLRQLYDLFTEEPLS
jgi:hypothetical protein